MPSLSRKHAYTLRMRGKYPPLRIHVWGGLGSQLFAVYLAYQIDQRYPGKSLTLVLHTGGVTRRSPEICDLFPEYEYREVDDFFSQGHVSSKKIKKNFVPNLKTTFRHLLLLTGLLAEENDDRSRKVRPWTMSARGHYFHKKVSSDFLNLLYSRLESQYRSLIGEYQSIDVLHYRLGDLMDLVEKKPIEPSQIVNALINIKHNEEITVFSDSPGIAVELLSNATIKTRFVGSSLSASEILFVSANAKLFIGTSSKISYWIVILRNSVISNSVNYIPKTDSVIMDNLIGDFHEVKYY